MANESIIQEVLYKEPLLDIFIPSKLPNVFREQEKESGTLPTYQEIKDKLPKPVWDNHESVIRAYDKAWELAFSNIKPCGKGFINHYIDTAFNEYIFLWDSAFMTQFGRYANHIFNFQNTLNNFYCNQATDGFIGREISKESGQCRYHRFDPVSTGPNILGWVEMLYYHQFKDKDRLEKVFPVILAYHRWLKMHRTWKDGSYWSSGWGCGMDNQMRVSQENYDHSYHDHRTWVDTCMQQALSAKSLMEMHHTLQSNVDIVDIVNEHKELTQLINEKLWDEETNFYYDADKNGKLDKKKSIGAYWAFLADIIPSDRKDSMVAQLLDELEFFTKNPIPTMPKSNPYFTENGDYWRGGVWAPTNYMVLKGLEKNNYTEECFMLAKNHLEHIVKIFEETNTLWENYAPNKLTPGNPAKKDFVGWTGLSPISIFIEYVLGIKVDHQQGIVICDIHLLEKHGISNLPCGTHEFLSLMIDKRENSEEEPKIEYQGKLPLLVRWNGKEKIIKK